MEDCNFVRAVGPVALRLIASRLSFSSDVPAGGG